MREQCSAIIATNSVQRAKSPEVQTSSRTIFAKAKKEDSSFMTYRTVRIGVAYRLGTLASADFLLGGVNRRKNDYQPFFLRLQVIRPNPEGTRSKSADREAQIPLRTIFAKAKKEDSSFDESLVAGVGFEPHDLRVMSPTSYQTAPSRDINGAGSRGRTGTRN